MRKYHILELITFAAVVAILSKSVEYNAKIAYAQQNNVEEQVVTEEHISAEDLEYSDIKLVKNSYNSTDKVYEFVKNDNSNITFIGDSRTVGMQQAGLINPEYGVIAKVGEGYNYLNNNIYRVNGVKDTNIVINLGVNDLGNIDKYIEKYKELSNSTDKSNKIYLVSVNPLEYHKTITNDDIEKFNGKIRELCSTYDNMEYIDTYNNIEWNAGFTQDGIHYTKEYYTKIYNYIYDSIYGQMA